MIRLFISFLVVLMVSCGGKKREKKDPWDEYLPKVQQMFEEAGGDTASLRALSDSLYAFYRSHPESKGKKDALYYACNWAYASFNYERTLERCGEFVQKFPSSVKFSEVIDIMTNFINNYPDAATLGYAYKYRGIALTYKGKYEEAKRDLEKAKTMLEVLGKYEEIEEIDKALRKLK